MGFFLFLHPAALRRATIMSRQSSAIVAQPSSSAKALKRFATPRGREMAAKGIEKKLPWSCLDRLETQAARDEVGQHQEMANTKKKFAFPASAPS